MRNRIRNIQQDREGGFTLIELLIVIVVLGILAGIVVFGISTFRGDSQVAACRASLKTINVAAGAYEAKDTNPYPGSITVLLPAGGNPGYLKADPGPTVGNLTFTAATHTVTSDKCVLTP